MFVALGLALLLGFFVYIRAREREGKEALLSTDLFRDRTSNLGLATQNIQWLLLMGTSFVVAVFLQTVRHFSAIKTGVIFTAATAGVLVSSLAAERLAKRHEQRTLIRTGFVVTIAGIALLIAFVGASKNVFAFVPGLLVIGLGLGVMLTPSVNIVQSAFPEQKQGEISGLSRSVSNLGSSFGTAIAGTILVSDLASGNRSYALAMAVLAVLALVGLAAALALPGQPRTVAHPVPQAILSRRGLGLVQRGRVRDSDDRPLRRLQPRHRLAPRLLARRVQQIVARVLQLLRRCGHRRRVGDVELDADLRHRPVRRPLVGPEARLGGLRQRPDTEVPAAVDPVGVVVRVGALALEGQPEGVDVEPAAGGRVGRDRRHAREELDVHAAMQADRVAICCAHALAQ